jgi:hypothetical protein
MTMTRQLTVADGARLQRFLAEVTAYDRALE